MKRVNTRRIKSKLSYTVHELANVVNVHPNTIHRWIEKGLPRIDGAYPYMVYGQEVIDFLIICQTKNKITLAADEFRCCKCNAPRKAWEGMADMRPHTSKTAILIAICECCNTSMSKIISLRNLVVIEQVFILHTHHRGTLVQSTNTNPYSETKGVPNHGEISPRK